ncbi:MAG: hypothetical protein NTZ05_15900 [Chloroflexi bacterium]|nr:hypothetical protein [Chloroflexota bacterium]
MQFEAEKGEVGFTHNSTDQDDQDRSPSGPSAPPPTPGQTVAERLEAALAALSEPGANGPAIAAGFYRTLFPLGEDQSFGQLCGRLGALARQGGGYGPLMQRLIELSGRRLSGDPLDYAVALGQQRINRGPPVALPAAASGGQTAGMPHYRTGFGARRVGATTAAGREA